MTQQNILMPSKNKNVMMLSAIRSSNCWLIEKLSNDCLQLRRAISFQAKRKRVT
jgi:hypothetical protein